MYDLVSVVQRLSSHLSLYEIAWWCQLVGLNTANLNLIQPSHVNLMLAGSCWRIQVGVCGRHSDMLADCWRKVGENRIKLIFRQQFAGMLLCRSHTPVWDCRHELANISLTCEGCLRKISTISCILSEQANMMGVVCICSWCLICSNFFYFTFFSCPLLLLFLYDVCAVGTAPQYLSPSLNLS